MPNRLHDTSQELTALAKKHDRALVGFSGGKDSIIVLDLAVRHFNEVVAFHMANIPSAPTLEKDLKARCAQYNVPLFFIPHWTFVEALKNGVFCDEREEILNMPWLSLRDCYDWAKGIAGADIILHGKKKADSLWAKRSILAMKDWKDIHYPIVEWNKQDVLSYIKMRGIKLPQQNNKSNTFGYDLSSDNVCWIHDNIPEDYEAFKKWFPYVGAIVARRDFYGIK